MTADELAGVRICPGDRACGECVRGLLCDECNRALGCMHDDPARLSALMVYLGPRLTKGLAA